MKNKRIPSLFLFLSLLFLLASCSSYMNNLYKDFDQEERSISDPEVAAADNFEQFRKAKKRKTSTQYNNFDRTVNTNNEKIVLPKIKRQYKSEKEVTKRYTASDLTDKESDGSLWAQSDPNAFLFSNNKVKNTGDIVQINVLSRLKNEITMELKKAFPDNPYETKTTPDASKATDPKVATGSNKPPSGGKEGSEKEKKENAPSEDAAGNTAQDKISGIVIEEINREHLLLKGRKNVLYKNRKRMVEVQLLISRKDIAENDSINSDAALESNVSVVK